MALVRAHILLPDDLLTDVDALVGPRGRSAFVIEVVREAVNRRRLLQMLDSAEPVLREEDYPEFRGGSEGWVRHLRDEDQQLEPKKVHEREGGGRGDK